jgi:hypothetical protein
MERIEMETRGFDCYYCSPMVLKEIAEILGVTSNHHGYFYEDGLAAGAR